MDSPTYKKIVRDLATKYGISYIEAKEAVNSQFIMTAEVMKSADRKKCDFKFIRLPLFGKFWIKPKRIEYLKKMNNDKTTKL